MRKCVNCGQRTAGTGQEQLCEKCAACETLYDAIVVRIRRQLLLVLRSFVLYLCLAVAVYVTELFPASQTVSIVLLYFALASSLLSAAQCLAQYIQLRKQRKAEG